MHRRVWLWATLLLGITLNLPQSIGVQSPSPRPTVTPGSDLANPPVNSSNQPQSTASPSPSPTGPSPSPNPATPSHTPTNPRALGHEKIVRLKIFLDSHSFGPGEIDDHWSELCANALRLYQRANGRNATGQIDPQLEQELINLPSIYTTYQIKPDDLASVGKSPQKPAAQAKLKHMPYPSVAEFVAERFHTSVSFLAELNPGKNLNQLRAGDSVKVPNVPPLEVETLKSADDIPPKPQLKSHHIEIDTKNKILTVMDGEKVLAAFPITPGSKQLPAPIGTWQIVKITTMPWFRWDKAMLLHGRRSGDFHSIPPGPRNEVGLVWIGLNKKGIGIHGTNNPSSIGRSASHGCIRLANWDAVRVINAVTQGVSVQIN
jgi:lipoprotein-anchoring transpeptidase ErfK/SrfK